MLELQITPMTAAMRTVLGRLMARRKSPTAVETSLVMLAAMTMRK